jgi:hypothetical protein
MEAEPAEEVTRRMRESSEWSVKDVLAQLPPEWVVFHDLHWPGLARPRVDHVVVGPGGVFVIDTVDWSGAVSVRDGTLHHDDEPHAVVVDGVRRASTAAAELVPSLSQYTFVPVLCFVGASGVDSYLDGVLTCRADALVAMLTNRPATLAPEWVAILAFELDLSTRGAEAAPVAMPWVPRPRRTTQVSRTGPRKRLRKRAFLLRTVVAVAFWWVVCVAAYYVVLRPVLDHL